MADSFTAPAPLLERSTWQMSMGERAALVGLLCDVKPELSIEIGTAEGGSLQRVAAHSKEVHSFDLVEPEPAARELPNVTFHTGDSHKLLPELLARLAEEGRNVDFALVDGDHSAGGVRQDMEDLFNSPAVSKTVIVMHDTMNEEVRRGLEDVRYGAWPKVAYVELDFVAGYLFRQPDLRNELWGGLGLVVVDASREAYFGGSPVQDRYQPTHHLVRMARDEIEQGEVEEPGDLVGVLAREREQHAAALADRDAEIERAGHALAEAHAAREALERSVSWKLTKPIRSAKQRLRRALS
jgi:hypothetical protein